MTPPADMAAVVEALARGERFLVTSHENPDGDALGSLLAMHLALVELGKDSVMVSVGEGPLPGEYAFLGLEGHGLLRTLPADAPERVLVAVDCAQETRLTDARLLELAPSVVNIDHHHDNTRFGTVDLVVDGASSTAEVLADVLAELGVALTPGIAEALYAGLVTDTGRFQYSNTTPKALRLAADLLEAGADIQRIFQGVYESMHFAKVKLLARALDRAALYEEGRVVVSYLLRTDFGEVGAVEPYSEGIIDTLRAIEGAELAALIREPPRQASHERKVSLRSSNDRIDVSAIARQSGAGGGHRQAAGFSSDDSIEEITSFIVAAYVAAADGAPAPA
jgi:bifunctional oligoribonuclease and PAP phosphatase NrnA